MPSVRILFMGTPDFAVPTLDALHREHEVVLAVAQPDKPAGRGMKMQAPAVAVRARELGIPLLQPPKVRAAEFLDAMRDLAPDIGIVIAYGKILPAALLEIPRHGFLNVHASVLPRWRGAAPIQRAIEAGDRVTGVTIMRVDEELDHGPMLAIETLEIEPDERTPGLAKRLSALGAEALLPVLRDVERGAAVETPQEHDKATLAPKIEKSEGAITFEETTAAIYNRFRAFDPWPGITFGEIKLTELGPVEDRQSCLSGQAGSPVLHQPRTVLSLEEDVVVATSDGAVRILEMQRPGKPRTPAGAVARGLGWRTGERLP
jgi:methionyl-tRNA formyltransferase